MIGLFDRDVFLKLACCDLWSEALSALDITEPKRLVSTSSISSNMRVLKRLLPDSDLTDIEARLSTMIAEVPIINDDLVDKAEGSEAFTRLADTDDIDAGEQLLLAILLNEPQKRVLVSGDKRCVEAFSSGFPDDFAEVRSSLISFERCLREIEKKYGFDLILQKAHAVRSCDGSLRIAFGTTPNADDFRAALASFDPLSEKTDAASVPSQPA